MTFAALDSALLGPLLTTAEMAAVFSDRAKIEAMLACEMALASAEANVGMVPETLALAIEAVSADVFDLAALGQATALSGVPSIPFLKVLQAHLPKELEPFLHKGATTQDIVDTATVLQMKQAFVLVRADLAQLVASLSELAKKHRLTPCVGRTYGQHAAPITFGFKAIVWCFGIADAAKQLDALENRALTASLFGPVGTFPVADTHAQDILHSYALELGLNTPPIAWHTLRARMAETGSWLAILLGALAKMATDIVSLASTEVGEVAEPFIPGRGGSSAMPHKRNPVACTIILANASAAKGHVMTLLDSMAAAHERPAGAWHAEWHALPQLFGLAAGALREAKLLAAGLVVDEARMRANIDLTRGLLFADAAAGLLATKMGREASHALVEHAAAQVRATGQALHEILRENPAILAAGLADKLADAFDLSPAVAAAANRTDNACAFAEEIARKLRVKEG